ncbi:hypothetical protein M902_2401 [Bacteriovorax sp. BAL6_X]|uniref:hypothetical protein n=1 Tax=Bacteriovorax sp. BAL6_X TaxID=1201290 RepID=UPI000385439B|nr:hypothetical protein [Bacteriovorax sp. BAL6_X]EPZ51781.1 hypothetical protein M902_2401 [Bacteriovorax sp. BAL6_X]
MKKLLMVAMLSLTSIAAPVSNSVITQAKKAVDKTAKAYFGPKVYVYYSKSSAEDKEVFFNVLWTEETADVYYDEGEQIYVPVKTECEQEMVYLVDSQKVLLTQNAYCY